MRGQDINLSNIETSIKKEVQNVKTNFDKWQKSGGYSDMRNNVGSILNMFWKVITIFVKFILIMVGISFFISGIAMLVSCQLLIDG